jgi:hypothetical protein
MNEEDIRRIVANGTKVLDQCREQRWELWEEVQALVRFVVAVDTMNEPAVSWSDEREAIQPIIDKYTTPLSAPHPSRPSSDAASAH